jgi:hypothetical protein
LETFSFGLTFGEICSKSVLNKKGTETNYPN